MLVSEYSEVDRITTALDTFLVNDRGKLTKTRGPGVFAVRTGVPDLSLDFVELGAHWVGQFLDPGVVERLRVSELEFVGRNARRD